MILSFEGGSSRSHYVEASFWRRSGPVVRQNIERMNECGAYIMAIVYNVSRWMSVVKLTSFSTCTALVWIFVQHASCVCWGKHHSFEKLRVRRGSDKSLARPGRKQATETKLGIFSTYSPWSSIHFLAHCFNLRKPLKKIQKVVRPTTSPRQQWPPRRTKNGDL